MHPNPQPPHLLAVDDVFNSALVRVQLLVLLQLSLLRLEVVHALVNVHQQLLRKGESRAGKLKGTEETGRRHGSDKVETGWRLSGDQLEVHLFNASALALGAVKLLQAFTLAALKHAATMFGNVRQGQRRSSLNLKHSSTLQSLSTSLT